MNGPRIPREALRPRALLSGVRLVRRGWWRWEATGRLRNSSAWVVGYGRTRRRALRDLYERRMGIGRHQVGQRDRFGRDRGGLQMHADDGRFALAATIVALVATIVLAVTVAGHRPPASPSCPARDARLESTCSTTTTVVTSSTAPSVATLVVTL